ncbi:MAG: hypothetical protein GX556_03700 [Fibrobacter sp.]|nr:hypothetical protein [Fibrobacter sp.]
MKQRYLTPFFVLCFCFVSYSASYEIEYGRRIQLDGFLPEWNSETAKKWGASQWIWDARRTPEGIVGYLRTEGKTVCREWKFSFTTPKGNTPLRISIPDTLDRSDFYRLDRDMLDSSGAVSLEWAIPWGQMDTTGSAKFSLLASGRSNCGDSLEEIRLTGAEESRSVITTPVIVQMILIAFLALVYIVVKIRIRNQTDRRESLRR